MIHPINRHLKRILLLACALLMLALPVAGLLDNHETSNSGLAGQQLAFNTAKDLIQEVGLPQAGLAHTSSKILNPNEFLCGAVNQSHAAAKAITGEKQCVSVLDFRCALQSIQIQFHQEHLCAPVSCRAPPVFSAFQYRI